MIPVISNEQFRSTFLNDNRNSANNQKEILAAASDVIEDIRNNGEAALKKYVEKFDGKVPDEWEVTETERKKAVEKVDKEIYEALELAARNIKSFHAKQLQNSRFMNAEEDVISGQLYRPIDRAGIYVPGGTASYPSTVLMNAIPAVLAGVEEVIMVTPVKNGEEISPVLLAAAELAGVHRIFKVGGIQAIAALAYGTTPIPRVDKIVGPGNAYVAAAKSLVYGDVGIDMIAGPSEVAIIADESAKPEYIAADLIAQAEHDTAARSILFTPSKRIADLVEKEVERQCEKLPRKEIASSALTYNSAIVLTADIDECFFLSNQLAPEHLEIQMNNPMEFLSKIRHAGSVFLGHFTPEALGDYFAGPNHVLPTSGTARFSSGLSVDDFIKKTTFLYYSEKALTDASSHIINLAEVERLEGHGKAVEVRLNQKKQTSSE